MISSGPLASSAYNGLPHLTRQTVPDEEILHAIGPIFIEHSMHRHYGIALLHKHFHLDDGEVMVHDGLVCGPQSSSSPGLSARSFFLDRAAFRAFEHESTSDLPPLPSDAFLQALSRHLVDNDLDQRLALTRVDTDPWAPILVERVGEGRTHVCTLSEKRTVNGHEVDYCGEEEMIDTEWRFRPCCCGGVKAKVSKKCVQIKDPPGGHMDV